MLNYTQFYKLYGVRVFQNLFTPKVKPLVAFPTASVVHYLSYDEENPNIDVSKPYLNPGKAHNALVDYIVQLTETKGNPKHKNTPIKNLVRPFLNHHHNYRLATPRVVGASSPQTLVINDYNFLSVVYKYTKLPLTNYYKWHNSQHTLFDEVNKTALVTNKNNFILIDVPEVLPGLSYLNIFSLKVNTALLKVFDNPNKLMILELWKWISVVNRGESVLSGLSEEALEKTSLVFKLADNRVSVLNMGIFNDWILKEPTESTQPVGYQPKTVQKYFLRYLMLLQKKGILEMPEPTAVDLALGATPTTTNIPVSDLINTDSSDIDTPLDEHKGLMTELEDSADKDIAELEHYSKVFLADKNIQIDAAGELIEPSVSVAVSRTELQAKVYTPTQPTDSVLAYLDNAVKFDLLPAIEYRKVKQDITNYRFIKNPYNPAKTIGDSLEITPKDIEINSDNTVIVASHVVLDKSMLHSTTAEYDSSYIKKVMQKDVLNMIGSTQRAGVIIKDHQIEIEHSLVGTSELHTVTFKPVDGVASTIKFKLPKVNEDGSITCNSSKYILRKQKNDLPIRKIDQKVVALSSYYGKTFVSTADKVAQSSVAWLLRQINKLSIVDGSGITNVIPGYYYSNTFQAPMVYSAMSENFKSFKIQGGYELIWDRAEILSAVPEAKIKELEVNGSRVCGFSVNGDILTMDIWNNISTGTTQLGFLPKLIGLPDKAPNDFTSVRVFSKLVPVGVVLGYLIGFENLLTLLGVRHTIVEGRYTVKPGEYKLVFSDRSYVFYKSDALDALILNGFNIVDDLIRKYPSTEFNSKNIYFNIFRELRLGSIYLKEVELMDALFVDPITESVLREISEPLTFKGLLIRSSELLLDRTYPDANDSNYTRIRGYERFPGFVYKEIVGSIRAFKNKPTRSRSKLEMSPYQVWNKVLKDPAIKLVSNTNPINNLKESEVVTYMGDGGRSKGAIVQKTRAYHVNDMGVISEATVDSTDVGVNTYLTGDPNLSSVRGLNGVPKPPTMTSIFSPSALLSVGVIGDDVKRINFISIQQTHCIASDGYHQPLLQTGYEYIVANRTTDNFAYNAKQDGEVTAINKQGIIVKYSDGTMRGVTLGRIFAKADDTFYPYEIKSNLKVGDSFKRGDNIAYNTSFFEQSFLDPTSLVMKNSMLVKTALLESSQTEEDSSAISPALTNKLKTKVTKLKKILVDFDQNVNDCVRAGQPIHHGDVLLIIEDAITAKSNYFNDKDIATLQRLSNQAPTSKYDGVIEKVEVVYNGSKDNMSESLKLLSDLSDKARYMAGKSINDIVITGSVTSDYRSGGTPLIPGKAEISIYITTVTDVGVGDKGVFGSQMKTIFGEVMDYSVTTESGETIDAIFGFRSVANRIVTSPAVMGTTNTLLKVIAKRAVSLYRS